MTTFEVFIYSEAFIGLCATVYHGCKFGALLLFKWEMRDVPRGYRPRRKP